MNTNYLTYKSEPCFMPIDRCVFFDGIKDELFGGKLHNEQLESINAILDECILQEVMDLRQIAYVLAVPYYFCYNKFDSTHKRITPMRECAAWMTLKGKPEFPYYGRSYSMIRFKHNYRSESTRLGIDLEYNPDLMLQVKVAANSHVFALSTGLYTGRKLGDYISARMCDYNKARRIIGGTKDRFIISGYAMQFERHLRKAAI